SWSRQASAPPPRRTQDKPGCRPVVASSGLPCNAEERRAERKVALAEERDLRLEDAAQDTVRPLRMQVVFGIARLEPEGDLEPLPPEKDHREQEHRDVAEPFDA